MTIPSKYNLVIILPLPADTEQQCLNGDVELLSDNTPTFYQNGTFHPICGHYFWDSNQGAQLFCQKLGYTAGKLDTLGKKQSYKQDSIWVGECHPSDTDISACGGGCNTYEVGGLCDGISYNCTAGEYVKMSIICSGGKSSKTSSCSGQYWVSYQKFSSL